MKASVRLKTMKVTVMSMVTGILAVGHLGTVDAAPIPLAPTIQVGSGGSFAPPASSQRVNSSAPRSSQDFQSLPPAPGAANRGFTPPNKAIGTTATRPVANEKTRQVYLRDARRALATGDLKRAEMIVTELKTLGGTYKKTEDSPANIEALINQVKAIARARNTLSKDLYDRSRAELLTVQADSLLYYGEAALAAKLAGEAKRLNVKFPAGQVTPDQVLAKAASVRGVSSVNTPDKQRLEVLNLTAQAQLALDQGNPGQARKLIAQAKALNVPETSFKPGDLRPWEVEVKLASAQRANVAPTNMQVQTPNRASRAIVQETEGSSEGRKIFQAAMQALRSNNRTAALAGFRKAWNYQDELTPQERNELKTAIDSLSQQSQQPKTVQSPTLDKIDQEQQIIYQRMSNEVFREKQVADRLNQQKNPRAALAHLESLRTRVNGSQLNATAKTQLMKVVERRIAEQESYIEGNLAEIKNDETNSIRMAEINSRREKKVEVDQQVQRLVEDFNTLIDEQRFAEAEMIARQANDLAPELDVVQALLWKSKFAKRLQRMQQIQSDKEEGFHYQITNVEKAGTGFNDNEPYQFGDAETWRDLSERRRNELSNSVGRSIQDIAIRNRIREQKIDARFESKPLFEVLGLMSEQANVNIRFDEAALAEMGVTQERAVSLQLREPISMEAALNNLLRDLNLTFTVKDEVVLITNEARKSRDVYAQTYYVADLVVPIPNFVASPAMGPISGLYNPNGLGYASNTQPHVNPNTGAAPTPGGAINPIALANQGLPGAPGTPQNGGANAQGAGFGGNQMAPGAGGGAAIADFEPLIDLIQNTIDPQSWLDTNGGPGTVQEFRANLSLVVSQTLENHERIQDLLESLRRLQDLQITIEVRFITLRDDFFERIGIDFDFDIEDASNLTQPLTNIPDAVNGAQVFGRDALGQPTNDLDLSFTQDSFTSAIPTFGGFDVNTAANFGFAILSDIEVFFLISASKGDNRSNITQAPKVTLFNGQTANINDQSLQPFVTSVEPVVGDFAAAQRPIITLLAEGTSLTVNAVASDDRRFVRMTLTPFFSQIGDVDTFTFTGTQSTTSGTNITDPTNPNNTIQDDATITTTGTTVQLPVFAFTTVNTTVSVPDGGTVLLGGIKRLNEARNERGVPFLSNIPYVSRLFKNVGIGRESQSLMLMVTPRIIIQDEEENRQVGGN